MKRKKISWFIWLVLTVCLYMVIFRTQSVTYQGENQDWIVTINAMLVGLNGSNNIRIHYKGKASVNIVEYNIYPNYQGGIAFLDQNGTHYEECKHDCGYYDQEKELLFFIVWKEGEFSEEKRQFITLRKITP